MNSKQPKKTQFTISALNIIIMIQNFKLQHQRSFIFATNARVEFYSCIGGDYISLFLLIIFSQLSILLFKIIKVNPGSFIFHLYYFCI